MNANSRRSGAWNPPNAEPAGPCRDCLRIRARCLGGTRIVGGTSCGRGPSEPAAGCIISKRRIAVSREDSSYWALCMQSSKSSNYSETNLPLSSMHINAGTCLNRRVSIVSCGESSRRQRVLGRTCHVGCSTRALQCPRT